MKTLMFVGASYCQSKYGDSSMEPPVAYFVSVRNESNISGILDKMIQDDNYALLGHYAGSNGNGKISNLSRVYC